MSLRRSRERLTDLLVVSEGLAINFFAVGSPVAVRTERNKIIRLVTLGLRPRNDMVNINVGRAAACLNGASVAGLHEDLPSNVRRDRRTVLHERGHLTSKSAASCRAA